MTKRAADGLDEFLELVTQRIAEAEVAGFDETGLRVAGALHWADRPHPHRSALGCGDAVMRNALARRLLDRQDDYLRLSPTGEYRPTTTAPSGTSV